MAEKAPDVAFSVVPSLIHTMGFDETLVQRALEQADGNEELAIDFIVSGEVHDCHQQFIDLGQLWVGRSSNLPAWKEKRKEGKKRS